MDLWIVWILIVRIMCVWVYHGKCAILETFCTFYIINTMLLYSTVSGWFNDKLNLLHENDFIIK